MKGEKENGGIGGKWEREQGEGGKGKGKEGKEEKGKGKKESLFSSMRNVGLSESSN